MPRIYRQLAHSIKALGDNTFLCLIDFGWRMPPWPVTLHLYNIETPGLHSPAGHAVSQHIERWLDVARTAAAEGRLELGVVSIAIDRVGQSMGDIELRQFGEQKATLSQWLLEQRLGRLSKRRGAPQDWSARDLLWIMQAQPTFPEFSLPASLPLAAPGQ